MLVNGIVMPYSLKKAYIMIQIDPKYKNIKDTPSFKLDWQVFETEIDNNYDFNQYGIRIVKIELINKWIDRYFGKDMYNGINQKLKQIFQKLI